MMGADSGSELTAAESRKRERGKLLGFRDSKYLLEESFFLSLRWIEKPGPLWASRLHKTEVLRMDGCRC